MQVPDIIIAIDGYSSTGKSSFAKIIAKEFSFLYLDSGALYRGVTLFAIENGFINDDCTIDVPGLDKAMAELDLHFGEGGTYIGERCIEKEIRSLEVAGKVSPIATVAEVRNFVDMKLREFGKKRRVVMDGRDIGTTVFPDAELKIFMTADPMIRAERRAAEMRAKGDEVKIEEVLKNLTGFYLTRGVLCAMRRPKLPEVSQIAANAKRIVVLENVMNPTNVGAIFRSAAALNMDAVLLTPACSNPLYRRSIRVSMGTVFQVPWTFIGDEENDCDWPETGLAKLKQLGFKTAAMALSDNSVSIDHPALMAEEKLAIILGTEGDGLSDATIADCDYTVKIPMSHGVDSLNVAAASAVAFWQLRTR